jgi:two-component system, LytTR family, response regulator AlgR
VTPRIFIVDDEPPARARLKMLLSDIEAECAHELVGEADNAQRALDGISAARPDIVLLDVQMPGITGIELAAHLKKLPPPAPIVIFTTAHDAYALSAFEVHALDYLLKPVRAARLADALRRASALSTRTASQATAIDAIAQSASRRHFSVQERGRLLLVPVADVIYLKAELKYVTLRTATHEHLIEESLTSIEDELAQVFVRVHRNALVARHAIAGVERGVQPIDGDADADKPQESWQVILRGVEERLPVSRRQWPVVKALVR